MRKVSLITSKGLLELVWEDNLYEGMYSTEGNKTILMYRGKEFTVELGQEELKDILFPFEVECTDSDNVDLTGMVTYINGSPVVNKATLTGLLSIKIDSDNWLESETSMKNWNNPTESFHFNSSAESEEWADLIDIAYIPDGSSFELIFRQNTMEANRRGNVSFEFMEMVYEAFGENTTKGILNGVAEYQFPLGGFQVIRKQVIKLILEYTNRYQLCCGWDASYYCPHHTTPDERV
jgi:hypothetical protein